MLYDQNPVHRRVITPWYDSRTVCLLMILAMLLVFLFALVGVYFAWESTLYREMIWTDDLSVSRDHVRSRNRVARTIDQADGDATVL